jgi:trigger factor
MTLVQEKDLPELNDEFAKSMGNFENLEALEKSISEGIEMEHKKKNEEKWRADTVEKIAAESQIDLPEILVEQELEKMMTELEQNIAGMGLALDAYLENIKKSKSELTKSWQEAAEKRVRAALVLKEIAASEEISVPAGEIEEEMNRVMAYYKSTGDMEKNIDMERLYNYTKGVLTNEKVFKFLENL